MMPSFFLLRMMKDLNDDAKDEGVKDEQDNDQAQICRASSSQRQIV